MKRPFSPDANAVARSSLVLGLLVLVATAVFATAVEHSPSITGQDQEVLQPVAFSHQHHVQGLGLDCRYCHTAVENSANAGMPDSATCVGCHAHIWNQAGMLEPVRTSVSTDRPLYWWRVNRLPDYVYFNHRVHVKKGIGCVSCHGEVSRMASVTQARSFLMRDCISCHESPARNLRPTSEVFNEDWYSAHPETEGARLMLENHIRKPSLTDCNVCHR